jgi:hypothetical protein
VSVVVSPRLRRLVVQRAHGVCEYCLIHQEDAYFSFHVDHIISRKQRGPTTEANLALACLRCNVAKGTDIGAIAGRPPRLVRLFHPREDAWGGHFRLTSARIVPLTDIAEATTQLLGLNASDRLILRRALIKAGRYPSAEALAYMTGDS